MIQFYKISPSSIGFTQSSELNWYLALGQRSLLIVQQSTPEVQGSYITFSDGMYIAPFGLVKVSAFKIPKVYDGNQEVPIILLAVFHDQTFPPIKIQVFPKEKLKDLIDEQTLLTKHGKGFLFSSYPFDGKLFSKVNQFNILHKLSGVIVKTVNLENKTSCNTLFTQPIQGRAVQFYLNGIKIEPRIDFSLSSLPGYLNLQFAKPVSGKLTCYAFTIC